MDRVSYLAVFCAIFAITWHCAAAQTVHIVGDGLGWTIPPNPSTYANWASGKTFRVGDTLVFNFVTNRHDVVRVPKASFDVCSDDNEIGNEISVGPANITLTVPGEQYYLSSFDGHCNAGQKLAITVVSSIPGGANAPSPSSSPNTGAPTGSRPPPPIPTVHIVGDGLGWTIPPDASTYSNWAAGKTFRVGDILVFNFVTNRDDVVRVPKASFDVCSDDDEIGNEITIGPANITLTVPGEHYYLSSFDGHCNAGQKLAITVVSSTPGGANAPSPSSSPNTGAPTGSRSPPSTPTVHIVGDGLGWTIPPNASTYTNWAAGKTFRVGDILVFNFVTNRDDVVRVPKASFDVCSDDDEIGNEINIGPANITLTAPGDYYYLSTFDGHCNAGQKLAITVVSSTPGGANAPSPNTGAPTGSRPPPPTPAVHIVGDNLGWTVPPTTSTYANWAAGKTFRVGDILVFNFVTNQHDVVEVPKASFDMCSDDNEIGQEITVGPANITLTTPGDHYYISTIDRQCQGGQKLAITVVSSTAGGANAPGTGGAAGSTVPSPPNSSSTSLVTSFLLVVLSIGVTLTF